MDSKLESDTGYDNYNLVNKRVIRYWNCT